MSNLNNSAQKFKVQVFVVIFYQAKQNKCKQNVIKLNKTNVNKTFKKEAWRATTNLVRGQNFFSMSHPTDMFRDAGNAKILFLSHSVQELSPKN